MGVKTTAEKSKQKSTGALQTRLRIGLNDPGMTPLLRAGLGGLAAAVRAIGPDALGEFGTVTVEHDSIVLDWEGSGSAEPFLKKLFEQCFRIVDGFIDLPGSYQGDPRIQVRMAMTDALRLTFLQHGSSAEKNGEAIAKAVEIDGQVKQVLVQAYRRFVHQDEWKSIAKELGKLPSKHGSIVLAGWANPGAVERHVGLGGTGIAYSPGEALCACFTIIGCLSYIGPNRSGILVVPQPSDLIQFAQSRPRMAPRTLEECIVASQGDGALAIHAALHADAVRGTADGVAGLVAMTFRSTSWASQQKSRTDTLISSRYDSVSLDAFHELISRCPPRIRFTKGKKADGPGGYWGIPSSLRGFVAENLARNRPFYKGFAMARTRDDPPRWLHRTYSAEDKLGALRYPDDLKGIKAMIGTLDGAEALLVNSIHTALRQRYGAIADENSGNPVAFKKRCQGERERWRLAFSGARTHEQIRHALVDLWSRGGTNRQLQGDGWMTVLPLLRPEEWETARDLALISLASYQGKGSEETTVAEPEGE